MQLSGVRPRVCLSRSYAAAAHLLLWARRAGDNDRLLHNQRAGGQQQPRRSTALCSKCELCHVVC